MNTGSRDELKLLADVGRIAAALERIARAAEQGQYGVTSEQVVGELSRQAAELGVVADEPAAPAAPAMPEVDVSSSTQNAFVQDWLTRYFTAEPPDPDRGHEFDAYESVIESVQGTYNYEDHQAGR